MRHRLFAAIALGALSLCLLSAREAAATPVCTDGYNGGAPRVACGNRIFPEAHNATGYVQYTADPRGYAEYRDGLDYLASQYSRWVSTTTLREVYDDADAVSAGDDRKRPFALDDTNDGRDIPVFKLTDHNVPDAGKKALFFSLSVHGNERGGLEGGVRTAEDLAIAAACMTGGTCPAVPVVCDKPYECPVSKYLSDGIANYQSTTGRDPVFTSYPITTLLRREVIYFIDFNIDGWAVGDYFKNPSGSYSRGNSIGTDLNRQMPSVGRINWNRNPLTESEMFYGTRFMHDVADAAPGDKMAFGADIHGETTSQAYMDIMYPAGQFDSVDHRRLMAIAERTKSVIDKTLFAGIIDEAEANTGGNEAEGNSGYTPLKPAHWATVWDTLGYTDSGFIGDYQATDLAVTGMDYEIFLNHSTPGKYWTVYLQENHINATRGIIKTAMAYALGQEDEFNEDNVRIDPEGRAGYVVNPDTVTDADENGAGRPTGRNGTPGLGQNGLPVEQRPYEVTNQQWFRDTSPLMTKRFVPIASGDIAEDAGALDVVDTLVLADAMVPADPGGRSVNAGDYWANVRAWVERGGNLVLTDRALYALEAMGLVAGDATSELKPGDTVKDVPVYLPYANFKNLDHAMTEGLRSNARQLVETVILGYGINGALSPNETIPRMQVVDSAVWQRMGGATLATTGNTSGSTDNTAQTSVGQAPVGAGQIRIVGGALPEPIEANDHRYGLRDYGMTYSGLFLMENSLVHDSPGLGNLPPRIGTRLAFTSESAESGQYTDEVLLQARLRDVGGSAIEDAVVIFDLMDGDEVADSWTDATNNQGVVTMPARLLERPGTFRLVARYAGDAENFRAATASTPFTIQREDVAMTLDFAGQGSTSRVRTRLVDADEATTAVAERPVGFTADGEAIGTDATDGAGLAEVAVPPRYRGAKHTFAAAFAGDDWFRPQQVEKRR